MKDSRLLSDIEAPILDTSVNAANIPTELKSLNNWVLWKPTWKEDLGKPGKWDKPPFRASNPEVGADTTNAKTWTNFQTAFESAKIECCGIGFVLSEVDGIVFVDLDHCRDPLSGNIDEWALDVVRLLDSYTELSPSGTGIHIFVYGSKPGDACKRGDVEIYAKARYATFTGLHLAGTPEILRERTEQIAEVYRQYLEPKQDAPERPNGTMPIASGLDDQAVIERASGAKDGGKFAALWRGDIAGYPSESEADLALCGKLHFWTGDRNRVDNLFRQSGLMRDKWLREDYANRTLDKACTGETHRVSLNGSNPQMASQTMMDDTSPLPRFSASDLYERAKAGGTEIPHLSIMGQPDLKVFLKGLSHMISAGPKSGKTEWLSSLCRDWAKEGLRIAFYTEEPLLIWEKRIGLWGELTSGLDILPVLGRSYAEIAADVERGSEDIVIVDTLKLLRIQRTSDDAEVSEALTPIIATCRNKGSTLVLAHHQRKDGGQYGEGISGSHAYLALVDVSLEIERVPKLQNRRKVTGIGRLLEFPEFSYEKTEGGMRYLGETSQGRTRRS